MSLHLLLYLVAFLCFVAAAAGVNSRMNLTAAGLALLVLTLLL